MSIIAPVMVEVLGNSTVPDRPPTSVGAVLTRGGVPPRVTLERCQRSRNASSRSPR
ncbi:hypothetical protein NONI108955_19130 [Nocardia ninae]